MHATLNKVQLTDTKKLCQQLIRILTHNLCTVLVIPI